VCPVSSSGAAPCAGIHVVCVDEKTGIQALQHLKPAKGVKPGWITRIEAEYIRHGTLCLIANLEVATGRLLAPTVGTTRTEADFLTHIQHTVALDPEGSGSSWSITSTPPVRHLGGVGRPALWPSNGVGCQG